MAVFAWQVIQKLRALEHMPGAIGLVIRGADYLF